MQHNNLNKYIVTPYMNDIRGLTGHPRLIYSKVHILLLSCCLKCIYCSCCVVSNNWDSDIYLNLFFSFIFLVSFQWGWLV